MAEQSTDPTAPSMKERIAQLSYEEARARLVDIVTRLEQGSIPLEESLRLWELGEALGHHCQAWLDGASARITAAEQGEPITDTAMPHQASPAQPAQPTQPVQPAQPPVQPSAQVPQQSAPTQNDRISQLQNAVNNVRSEDIPAVQLPEPQQVSASPEDDETPLDTTPLMMHPEDFE